MNNGKVAILGGGLVGSLLSIFLKKEGIDLEVYEKRKDPRHHIIDGGRSINLALSHRGLEALHQVGLKEIALKCGIPMKGRMIHNKNGEVNFQPYGKKGQAIYSISRTGLNKIIIDESIKEGTTFHFEHKSKSISLEPIEVEFYNENKIRPEVLIGADGAFSCVRGEMQKSGWFNFSQEYLEHGYKELCIPPKNDDFAIEPEALHIWPRGGFMLIALPNLDKSFTTTLFLPYKGEKSYEKLTDSKSLYRFFEEEFPDALELMPNLEKDFRENPTSSLMSISSYPWFLKNNLLIGDAAHAIVPFYGQGMNAGFEDCSIFIKILREEQFNWERSFLKFQEKRKPDTDAIRQLALNNFIEMRDKVSSPDFLFRKKVDAELALRYPDLWQTMYSMVTFSNTSYMKAHKDGVLKEHILVEFTSGKSDLSEVNLALILEEYLSRRNGNH